MPDIQTALLKAINEWASDDQPQQPKEKETMTDTKPHFSITTNVSRATFEYVRDNPNQHHRAIIRALAARGHKESSVSALLSQFRRCGTMTRSDERFYKTTTDTYEAPTLAKLNRSKAKSKAEPRSTMPLPPPTLPERKPHPALTAGLAAIQPTQPPGISNDIEYILNTLPIKQAKALYDELHKIFGATK